MSDETWLDRMPRSVLDPYDAHDQPVFTPTDRRMLWHLEGEMAATAPIGSRLSQLAGDLRSYLNETCERTGIGASGATSTGTCRASPPRTPTTGTDGGAEARTDRPTSAPSLMRRLRRTVLGSCGR